MKRLTVYLIIFLPLLSFGQKTLSPVTYNKVVIDSRKSFEISKGDSITTVVIDTLIMKDKSTLILKNKKKVDLIVRHAVIGKNCVMLGQDGKNNGTDLTMSVNLQALKSLFVDVAGRDALSGNRQFDNGNGGHVTLNYLSSGEKPQLVDKRATNYLSVFNQGAGQTVNAQTDIPIIIDRVRMGSAGRRLGQFPNGRIYSANIGRTGKTAIKATERLPDYN